MAENTVLIKLKKSRAPLRGNVTKATKALQEELKKDTPDIEELVILLDLLNKKTKG